MIDKQQQINELDTTIRDIVKSNYVNVPQYSKYGGYDYLKAIFTREIAEALYNAGYRKVGEDETVVKANKYKRLVSTLKDLKAMAHDVDDYQDDIIADYRNLAESYMNQIIEELLGLNVEELL